MTMMILMATSSSASHERLTALMSGFLIGSSLTMIAAYVQERRRRKGAQQELCHTTTTVAFSSSSLSSSPSSLPRRPLPLHIRQEQLSRHQLYFGDDGMLALHQARVCVVGLGGVGSHTAVMLARGGIGHLRLVDFDQVSLSSLNRHACATLASVGIPKVTCVKSFISEICPDITVEAHVEMLTAESAPQLLSISSTEYRPSSFELVVDAIDDVPTKAALIAHCLREKLRVVSCMGAGGKADMTRLHISDLRSASRDPLASKLRQFLKKEMNKNGDDDSYLDDMSQLAIIYSSEKTVVKLTDLTDEQKQEGIHTYGAVDGMRIRILPVLGTMPAIMGQSLAALALTEIGNKPFQPVTGERVGRSVRHKAYQHLMRREEKITKRVLAQSGQEVDKRPENWGGSLVQGTWIGPIQVDHDDVEYLLEIWRNRCAVSNARLGTVLELVRWDLSKPAACDNLVLMGVDTIKQLDAMGNEKDWIPKDIQKRVEERLATCRLER